VKGCSWSRSTSGEKTLVFCATQDHALAVRDLINQMKTSQDPNYCQRVTANDGELGEQHLRDFQDNEKTIPTILTTSQKLSTGVDARNIRNIVLMRPDQLDDRVQADHRARHAALRRQGLLHHLRPPRSWAKRALGVTIGA
jgi:superfamily II DNA or RNA helicase